MTDKALKTLEYDKIITLLTEQASSPAGRELCRGLLPLCDLSLIQQAQRETTDALRLVFQKGSLSFQGAKDVRDSLKRLNIGGVLSIEELSRILGVLDTASRAKSYGRPEREDQPETSLDPLFASLEPLPALAGEIRRCISGDLEIHDDASPALKQIRRQMGGINGKIHSQLNAMVNSAATKTYLQDAVITMRNGRYCLPVKAEYRSQVPGMIHDQSSTGSTFFIEPMAVVKLNNDLKELLLKEQDEIDAILATLSALAAEDAGSLETDCAVLAKLDFIFARALLSRSYDGSEPVFNDRGAIRIKKGRHPLIDKKKAVPIDIYIGEDFDQLIITGPNTGGKTVSLKTVGLLTLMGQAGLHIPAGAQSSLSVFESIYADIGDEQSIEQSLSTFSSHMTNIVSFLGNVEQNSLVLFDELGAGTDPTEGAALAMAILSHLHQMGVTTLATTHYSELKVYALSTPGVENASCEFDVETLSPTYRLLMGIPGKSNAFAISEKLGLPDYIIADAKSYMSEQAQSFESLIADLEQSRALIEQEQLEIQQYREEIEALRNKTEEKQQSISRRREEILQAANEQARAILREAKEYADQTIRDFHRYGVPTEDMRSMEQARSELRKKMDSLGAEHAGSKGQGGAKKPPEAVQVGDTVRVLTLGLTGTVSTLPNAKGNLYVQMGSLRSQVRLKDIEWVSSASKEDPKSSRTGIGKLKMSKSSYAATEINLLGKTTDEAISLLDKFLDDAYLAHAPSVRIVHGKGTGALRAATHKHLKSLKYVKSFRPGSFGEGENGVTIVEFE